MRRLALLTLSLLTACTASESSTTLEDGPSETPADDTSSISDDSPTDTATIVDTGVDAPIVLDAPVKPGNKPPAVNAGVDQVITLPLDRVTLVGAATDSDGTIVGYSWTKVSGPASYVGRGETSPSLVATSLIPGDYVFRFSVQDDGGAIVSDEVTVTVKGLVKAPDSAMEHVASQPSPVFRAGHTMAPLVLGGYTDSLAFNQLLTEKYLYALHLGSAIKYWADLVATPSSDPAKKLALKASNPRKYPLSIAVDRPTSYADNTAHCKTEQAMRAANPLVALKKADGSLYVRGKDGTGAECFEFSPAAPSTAFKSQGTETGKQLKVFVDYLKAKGVNDIDVIHNYGEYGLDVPVGPGPDGADVFVRTRRWWDDKDVTAAWGAIPADKYLMLEKAYTEVSKAKSLQESAITNEIFAQSGLGAGSRYLYYLSRQAPSTGRWGEWRQFAWDYAEFFKTRVSRTPDNVAVGQMYYFDPDFFGDLGIPGALPGCAKSNVRTHSTLTGVLNEKAWQIKAGSPLSHNWLWTNSSCDGTVIYAQRDLMMGFIKSYYTSGMIGATVFNLNLSLIYGSNVNKTGVAALPRWLETYIDLGEVHALFSHLEDYLRNGDLLPGEDKTPLAARVPTVLPAYEMRVYTTGTTTRDTKVRVVARKHRTKGSYLVTGFAADGKDRDVDVSLDGATLKLNFRAAGSVYEVTKGGAGLVSKLIDINAMRPTGHMLESD